MLNVITASLFTASSLLGVVSTGISELAVTIGLLLNAYAALASPITVALQAQQFAFVSQAMGGRVVAQIISVNKTRVHAMPSCVHVVLPRRRHRLSPAYRPSTARM